MATRAHRTHVDVVAPTARVFALLHTPSAIRFWWAASRAIVLPREGGIWVATWGAREDDPDYVTAAAIAVFEPPRRLVLEHFRYLPRAGPSPSQTPLTITFELDATVKGCRLRVTQEGFPADPAGDEFYADCVRAWTAACEGIGRCLLASRC